MVLKLFTFAFIISCIPNQILTLALSCNGQVDASNFPEEQPKLNHLDSNEEGSLSSHKDNIVNHQMESLPLAVDEFGNDNSNKYNKIVLVPRKFYYPQRIDRGFQWPNEFHPFAETRKRSEKGMLLDAPEFILNPSAGSGGNSRRVGGLMKSSG